MPVLAFKMPARVASRSRTTSKGRGGRKGGRDRRGSGPERRRVLKPQNYSITPAIKAWRPPVPEPLPPAPLLSPGSLLALGGLVLLQLWGWLNGRPKLKKDIPDGVFAAPEGRWNPTGLNRYVVTWRGTHRNYNTCNLSERDGSWTETRSAPAVVWVKKQNVSGPHSNCGGIYPYVENDGHILFSSQVGDVANSGLSAFALTGNYLVGTAVVSVTVSPVSGSGVPYPSPPDIPVEGYRPPVPPVADLLLAPLPLPLPRPANTPQVVVVEQQGAAPVATAEEPLPRPPVVRATSPVRQQQVPGAVTLQNGVLPSAVPAPVPTTDPGAVVPWPGADPIPGTGPAPRPTPEGMAQELGRLERKLEIMNTPGAPGNLVDRFGDLSQLIGPIIDAIQSANSGTVYTLDSPCEVDAEGQRLPAREVQAPGALSQFDAILNRIDALAVLLQAHKDLKQPNCRGADVPIGGEFVTVNFEQID